MSDNGFRFGDWQIDPDSNTLRSDGATSTIEPKAMDVLRYLCRHAGAVIPPEELLQACWGSAELGDNPIHKAITQLRRALGDSASEPRYIETVRKRGYRAIAPVIATEDALEGSWKQGSPFRGLESFQESHAAIFFGRMQATAQLRELVLNQISSGCAMALVLGPSGSGKTSLVRAGLLPGLMASRTGSGEPVALTCTLYMDCADLADGNLFQALAAVLMDAEVGGQLLFAGENAEGLGRWLESSDAAAIAGRFAEVAGRIKVGLFVDRLEAIFRAPGVTDEIRTRFIAVLEHLASARAVLVMLACRNDFYPEVIALPALMALKSRGGHFDLNPPDGAEIAQMVRMPAKVAGLKFEVDPATGASLDDVLCDAARGNPDTLPLLQYCLDELYRQRSEDGTLRFDAFKQLGGIEGALAVRAEQVVDILMSPQLAVLPHILSLIIDVSEEQNIVTSRRAAWSGLQSNEARELVQALVDARLFVSELAVDGVPSFSVAHEALLRRWPRVSGWIEQHRQTLQVRTRISKDADRWIKARKAKDLLLPKGSQTNQAKDLLDFPGFSLSKNENEYIHASLARVTLVERIRVTIMIIIIFLATSSTVLGIFARRAQANAEMHRAEADNLIGYMLGEFADKLRPLGRLDLLDDISNRALAYLSAIPNASEAPPIQRAKALQTISEVNIARSNSEKAIIALTAARRILLAHYGENNNVSKPLLKDLGENSFLLGQIYFNQGDWTTAEKYFLEYKAYSENMAKKDPNDIDAWIEQSYADNTLGSLALRRGNIQQAAKAFLASVNLKRKALEKRPTDRKLQADLANSLSWLADATIKSGKLQPAMALYNEEEALLRPLHLNAPEDGLWMQRLANAKWHQSELRFALGEQQAGEKDLHESETILKNLVELDPSNKKWHISLYTIQLNLFDSLLDEKNPNLILKQHALLEKLVQLHELEPKNSYVQQLVAKAHLGIAKTYLRENSLNNSEQHLGRSIEILERLYQDKKEDKGIAIILSNALLEMSKLRNINGQSAVVQKLCQHALSILSPHSKDSQDYMVLAPEVRAYLCIGDYLSAKGKQEMLKKMNYREIHHEKYVTSTLTNKGKI